MSVNVGPIKDIAQDKEFLNIWYDDEEELAYVMSYLRNRAHVFGDRFTEDHKQDDYRMTLKFMSPRDANIAYQVVRLLLDDYRYERPR